MKLNNKGMTTVEIVVCFVLVTTISMAMYSLVSSFNAKREEESYRAKILVYKATITKKIQDDVIKKGLIYAKTETKEVYVNKNTKEIETSPSDPTNYEPNITMQKAECVFKDGSKRDLVVLYRYTEHELHPEGTNLSDYFEIRYGDPDEMEIYELPDLGKVEGECKQNDDADPDNGCTFTPKSGTNRISQDLKLSSVSMSLSNQNNVDETSNVLNIYIGFYHPDLGNRYAINIVAPINYQ